MMTVVHLQMITLGDDDKCGSSTLWKLRLLMAVVTCSSIDFRWQKWRALTIVVTYSGTDL